MQRFPLKIHTPSRLRRVGIRFTQLALASVLVALPSGVMGGGGIGFSDAETLLLKALREVRLSQLDLARQTIDELLARYPNFRLAYLVQGDLWLAKAKPLLSLGNTSEIAALLWLAKGRLARGRRDEN